MKPMIPIRALLATCGATVLLAACGGSDDSGPPPPQAAYKAEVRRTSFGVPHIKADNEKGLGYGIGYAFAQDNFCVLADMVVTVNGERSKYFGPAATYDSSGGGDMQLNLSSDFYHKYLNDPDAVQATWDRQPTEIKDLSEGYVAGINRYLKDTGVAGLADACKNQPWVRPLTALDLMRMQRRFAVTASGANFMDALYAAQPPVAAPGKRKSAAPAQISGYTPAPDGFWDRFRTKMGSNGVALGKEATTSGKGLLLANPHFPWTTAFRFYQMHLTIPGKVDVMGASLYGFPGINIGFNQNVAWTHTVNTSTHFTLFYLQLDPADPTKYIVDGQSRAMTKKELTVDVADGKGGSTPLKRTYYFSDFGPVMTMPGTFDWTNDVVYALADANVDNDRMFQQWWAMDKAKSLAEFKDSVESILGIPWVHAIAVDKAGSTYYGDVTPVPAVTSAKEALCIAPPFQPLIAQGIYVLAGTTAACQWDNDPSTPQKGIFPASELPTLSRNDYVQNSNDSAWMTNPAAPLTGYPSIVSADSTELSGRTRIGLTQIAQRLAGSDGLAGTRFDMASLQKVAFSNRSMYSTVLLDDLKTVCDSAPVELASACQVVKNWDGTANIDSTGWPLFLAWRQAMDSGAPLNYWTVPFSAADPVNTPRGLRVTDPAVVNAARAALYSAASSLTAAGIDFAKPWGDIQVAVRGDLRIPISGGGGNEIYNAMQSVPVGNGQMNAFYGSSIVMTVSFEGDTPQAQGFLTYSQSTDPKSPYYADQTQRFSKLDWISYPFTESAITSDPDYKTQTISE